MDESNKRLDWKKVFKEILSSQDQSTDEKGVCLNGLKSEVGFRPKEKDILKDNSSSCHKSSSSNENGANGTSEDSKFKSSQKVFSKKLVGDELTVNGLQVTRSSTKQKYSFSIVGENVQVPEWNKVFKSILGNNSTVPDIREQKNTYEQNTFVVKKQENFQKYDVPLSTRYTPLKKLHKIPKSKVNPEEEKVREIFALSQLFKLNCQNNLNEFEGAGVDIFKHDKKSFPVSFVKTSESKTESRNNSLDDSEPFVPLTGFVANYKPYTRADLLASPIIPFTEEPWDDNLLI